MANASPGIGFALINVGFRTGGAWQCSAGLDSITAVKSVDGVQALRTLTKLALRRFGLRVVTMREEMPDGITA